MLLEKTQSRFANFFFSDTRSSWLWLIVRLYVGWQWLSAGWEKLQSPQWAGSQAGVAIKGVLSGALSQISGAHPNVQPWYGDFIGGFVLHHVVAFSYVVTCGELLVGAALILGIFTATAAFFGSFMNLNYLMAGVVSTNPVLLVLEVFLVLAWRVAGWYGIDRYIPKMFRSRI